MKLMPTTAITRWHDRVESHAAYQPHFGHHYDRLRNHRRSWSIPFTMLVARRRAGTTRFFSTEEPDVMNIEIGKPTAPAATVNFWLEPDAKDGVHLRAKHSRDRHDQTVLICAVGDRGGIEVKSIHQQGLADALGAPIGQMPTISGKLSGLRENISPAFVGSLLPKEMPQPILHLMQAFARGAMSWSEFEYLWEHAPRFMRMLCEGFGMTKAELSKHIVDRAITVDGIAQAMK